MAQATEVLARYVAVVDAEVLGTYGVHVLATRVGDVRDWLMPRLFDHTKSSSVNPPRNNATHRTATGGRRRYR